MRQVLATSRTRGGRNEAEFDVVTGAFSYSGAAIAKALIATGRTVRTMTGHPERGHDHPDIDARLLDFDDQLGLVDSLRGATTLYNTYWVRFAHHRIDHEIAVSNSRALFLAAKRAGVERIVHVSITNPSIESPFPYFRGKALVERSLAECEIPSAILRPAILFGGDGVLINNIAWLVRHSPVFAVGGDGNYRIRGIHVDDLARLCLEAAGETVDSVTDAVGPERPTFNELVSMVREAVGARTRVVHLPGALLPPVSSLLGLALHDVLLTRDEYRAMAAGLADTDGPPTGSIGLSTWILDNRNELGLHYANELQRHFSSPG
jgi:uncharacterized protein YbjT (DUF2867 family)